MTEVQFHGLPVLTARGVMTPRRTSEALVRTAVEIVGDRRVRVADVGTGSGAIAVALAVALPRAEIFATDTNPAAVALTRDNVDRLGLSDRVTVYTGELLEPVAAPLDLVVANLPYLPIAEAPWHRELADEPRDAVFAPGDGLRLYRRLIEASRERLGVDGSLVLQLRRRVMTARWAELGGLSRALAHPDPDWGVTGSPRSRRLGLAESAKRAAPYVSRLAVAATGRFVRSARANVERHGVDRSMSRTDTLQAAMAEKTKEGMPAEIRAALRDADHTALLVVDVQNDFCHEDGVCAQAGGYPVETTHSAVAQVEKLLEAARNSGVRVLHARLRVDWENEDEGWLDRLLRLRQPNLCSPESFGEAAYTGAEELPDEPVIYKRRFSAFWETGLAEQLREMGVTQLIVCGVATNICVQATACDAFMDGFRVFFVSDASGAYSAEGHEAALTLMDLAYGDVVDTQTVVGAISENKAVAAGS